MTISLTMKLRELIVGVMNLFEIGMLSMKLYQNNFRNSSMKMNYHCSSKERQIFFSWIKSKIQKLTKVSSRNTVREHKKWLLTLMNELNIYLSCKLRWPSLWSQFVLVSECLMMKRGSRSGVVYIISSSNLRSSANGLMILINFWVYGDPLLSKTKCPTVLLLVLFSVILRFSVSEIHLGS